MKHLLTLCFVSLFIQFTNAQDSVAVQKLKSPYTTSFKKDGPVTAAAVGLTAFGVYLIQNKKDITTSELLSKTKEDVNFFDRGSAGNYSEKANDDSYIPFYGSFAMPVVMGLLLKNERNKFGQVMVLYTQTMAITSSMFTIAAGAINRSRPLVYGNAPMDLKLAGKSQRSFYAGHTAASAAATFLQQGFSRIFILILKSDIMFGL